MVSRIRRLKVSMVFLLSLAVCPLPLRTGPGTGVEEPARGIRNLQILSGCFGLDRRLTKTTLGTHGPHVLSVRGWGFGEAFRYVCQARTE